MQAERLGPFSGVRWFCNDGSVLPPVEYACVEHGGGRQHGELGQKALQLREAGVPLGNVLAGLDPAQLVAQRGALLRDVLVERYLIQAHDGWIYHKARFVRGAFQVEDEERAADAIILTLIADLGLLQRDFLLLREALRLLPHARARQGLDTIRGLSTTLAELQPAFVPLRNKIHSQPDSEDAARVRAFADSERDAHVAGQLGYLAALLDSAYAFRLDIAQIRRLATQTKNPVLEQIAADLAVARNGLDQLDHLGRLLVELRRRIPAYTPAQRLQALDLSLATEQRAFIVSRSIDRTTLGRAEQFRGLLLMAKAAYGAGLLHYREYNELALLLRRHQLPVWSTKDFAAAVRYFSLVPQWASRQLQFYFADSTAAFAPVEPLANGFVPDRLRASTLLSFGEWLEQLSVDANRFSGVEHRLFGKTVALGLKGLNPGLARGRLRTLQGETEPGPADIVIAPATTPELPRVGGILTADAGNLLSHVQLLASNLGIPNVVIGEKTAAVISSQLGQKVVLAVSPGGVVRLEADSERWNSLFREAEAASAPNLNINLDKLDLTRRTPIALRDLGVADSGRSVGPKAANLAQLAQQFPGTVSAAVVIPFGVFRGLLERPMADSGQSAFDWLKQQYTQVRSMPEGIKREAFVSRFLEKLRGWITQQKMDAALREKLRELMQEQFGRDGSYGVFVRSDTNVEDLPGFTGAGLNLTVPNVVGFDNILEAIPRVWASPFTERAFRWRQEIVDRPEHVYPSVLLHRTVPGDKSGVMITADLYTNEPNRVTIVTNEGVGGGVNGQSAETLQYSMDGNTQYFLGSATEPWKRIVDPQGGSRLVAASGAPRLLFPSEAEQLLDVARQLPARYPSLVDPEGVPIPADVEFAFVKGKLYLNQIRPFVQNHRARKQKHLLAMDETAEGVQQVDMRGWP